MCCIKTDRDVVWAPQKSHRLAQRRVGSPKQLAIHPPTLFLQPPCRERRGHGEDAEARDAFEQGNGNSPELVTKLKLAHCGGDEEDVNDDSFSGALGLISSSTQSRGGVFGKRVSEFANPQHEFTDPESHYDKLCQDEGKMACFALRG